METNIVWSDIIGVQTTNIINVIRIIYEEHPTVIVDGSHSVRINDWDENISTIHLKANSILLDNSSYKPISSNFSKEIINKLIKCSRNIGRKDLPLENEIISYASNIAITTRRGAGNYAIFSNNSYKEFLQTNPITYNHHTSNLINSSIRCYLSSELDSGIIVGYMGSNFNSVDCGIVLSLVDGKYQIYADDQSEKYYRYIN